MSKTTTYFWKICKKSHGKRGIVSLVSNESLFFACHVSLLFNTQGSFVSKLQPIKTSHFWQGAWGRIGISEGFYFWAHEGASDVNGLKKFYFDKEVFWTSFARLENIFQSCVQIQTSDILISWLGAPQICKLNLCMNLVHTFSI